MKQPAHKLITLRFLRSSENRRPRKIRTIARVSGRMFKCAVQERMQP